MTVWILSNCEMIAYQVFPCTESLGQMRLLTGMAHVAWKGVKNETINVCSLIEPIDATEAEGTCFTKLCLQRAGKSQWGS